MYHIIMLKLFVESRPRIFFLEGGGGGEEGESIPFCWGESYSTGQGPFLVFRPALWLTSHQIECQADHHAL